MRKANIGSVKTKLYIFSDGVMRLKNQILFMTGKISGLNRPMAAVILFMTHLSLYLVFCLCIFIPAKATSSENQMQMSNKVRLYGYKIKDFSSIPQEMNLGRFIKNRTWQSVYIQRNDEGTELRFVDVENKRCLFVSCKQKSEILDMPGSITWFNDYRKPVVWREGRNFYTRISEHRRVFDVDPSGRYFVHFSSGYNIVVSSVDQPNLDSEEIEEMGPGYLDIYSKENKIYLFGAGNKKYYEKNQIVLVILEKDEQKYNKKFTIEIPAPRKGSRYYTEDFSPITQDVLIVDAQDFPHSSKWYVYNLKSRSMKKIGKAKMRGFFLQCDVIEKAKKVLNK